jgi:hypothetical protein
MLLKNGIIEKLFLAGEKIPTQVKKINLEGTYAMPGFIDSHTHLISRGLELQRVDLETCTSLNECLEHLHVAVVRGDTVIFGSNWDESRWREDSREDIDKKTLDRISKEKPVIMRRVCGHFAVVNTRALDYIPRTWTIVDRKKGYLYEDVVLNLNEIFKPSPQMLERALELATAEAVSHGITSVHEIATVERFRLLQKARKKNKVSVRYTVYIPLQYMDEVISKGLSSTQSDDWVRCAGIKLFLDGAIGARTAALSKPYEHTSKRGMLLIPTRRLKKIIRIAEENGFQLMIHSIGDRATHTVLKIFENSIDTKNPLRHRLEHLELLDDNSVDTMARYNIIASMQPNFVERWQHPGGLYEQYLGTRYTEMNCFKKLLTAGVRVVFGSDCMPVGPLYGIQGALSHPSVAGRLTVPEAFFCYITSPAYATFDECKKGRFDRGTFGDIVVLDKDPRTTRCDEIRVKMVFIHGEVVYINKSRHETHPVDF